MMKKKKKKTKSRRYHSKRRKKHVKKRSKASRSVKKATKKVLKHPKLAIKRIKFTGKAAKPVKKTLNQRTYAEILNDYLKHNPSFSYNKAVKKLENQNVLQREYDKIVQKRRLEYRIKTYRKKFNIPKNRTSSDILKSRGYKNWRSKKRRKKEIALRKLQDLHTVVLPSKKKATAKEKQTYKNIGEWIFNKAYEKEIEYIREVRFVEINVFKKHEGLKGMILKPDKLIDLIYKTIHNSKFDYYGYRFYMTAYKKNGRRMERVFQDRTSLYYHFSKAHFTRDFIAGSIGVLVYDFIANFGESPDRITIDDIDIFGWKTI